MITLENITKKYNTKYVLKNVNIAFEKGQSVAFVGHNGCGKSTMLKIISGLVAPTSGVVKHERRIHFSYIPEKLCLQN